MNISSRRNKHGIPLAFIPRVPGFQNKPIHNEQSCRNPKTGKPKLVFRTQDDATAWISRNGSNIYKTYPCGDHFHLTTGL
jgi:hypothetical protein